MPKVLEFENPDGTSTLVAIRQPGDDVQPVSLSDSALKAIQKAEQRLDTLLRSVVGMGSSLQQAIGDAPVETATLEVGLQFTGKGRLYVVESEAQAAIKVTLTIAPAVKSDSRPG